MLKKLSLPKKSGPLYLLKLEKYFRSCRTRTLSSTKKCQGKQRTRYTAFIDLLKAFELVSQSNEKIDYSLKI